MTISISVTPEVEAKLRERAAAQGKEVAVVASELIAAAVARPSVEELLEPYRRQVAESGMSDQELDEFHRGLLREVRQQKRAKSA